MRWERGKDFVEIASGVSTDAQESVWYIESSLELKDLPVEFRRQISKTDEDGYKNLKRSVSSWAERNGYDLLSSDAP
jgi:hypothetical protein